MGAHKLRIGALVMVVLLIWGALLYRAVIFSAAPPAPLPTVQILPSLTPTPSPTYTPVPTWTPTPTRQPTPTLAPDVTPSPTPTPMRGVRPTAAPWTVTPTLNPSSTFTIPTPVPAFAIPRDAITIVLLGSDQRPDWNYWNTDVIQYVVIYPDIPSVAVLSIPRDLYVMVPDFWMARINTAHALGQRYHYPGGGFGLLNQTMLYNLGITAQFYAMVNFDGLIGLVNTMGGIDVPVHCYLEDYWPYPDANGEYHKIALEPGVYHMDGELALWYSRSRKTTSVFSRERRQQQVLVAMWRRAKQLNLLEDAPALYEQTKDLYKTNLGLGNILQLALVATQLDPVNVELNNIGRYHVVPYTTEQGGNVFLPNWERMQVPIRETIARPLSNRATQNPVRVEILNHNHHADWDQLAADRAYRYGFIPTILPSDGITQTTTQIIFYGDTVKGSGLAELEKAFGITEANVVYSPNPAAPVKLRIILGEDYQPCF